MYASARTYASLGVGQVGGADDSRLPSPDHQKSRTGRLADCLSGMVIVDILSTG